MELFLIGFFLLAFFYIYMGGVFFFRYDLDFGLSGFFIYLLVVLWLSF